LIPPSIREDEQMSGKRIQLHRLRHHCVQPVEALAHVAGRGAQIHAHAGRQMYHARSRKTLSRVRSVIASAPGAMRRRSPEASTSSMGALSLADVPASTKANRTGRLAFRVLSGAPYGYRYMKKSDSTAAYYEVSEVEADVVRLVFQSDAMTAKV